MLLALIAGTSVSAYFAVQESTRATSEAEARKDEKKQREEAQKQTGIAKDQTGIAIASLEQERLAKEQAVEADMVANDVLHAPWRHRDGGFRIDRLEQQMPGHCPRQISQRPCVPAMDTSRWESTQRTGHAGLRRAHQQGDLCCRRIDVTGGKVERGRIG